MSDFGLKAVDQNIAILGSEPGTFSLIVLTANGITG